MVALSKQLVQALGIIGIDGVLVFLQIVDEGAAFLGEELGAMILAGW